MQALQNHLLRLVGNDKRSLHGIIWITSVGRSTDYKSGLSEVRGARHVTQLTRGKRNGCNVIALPIYAGVTMSCVLATNRLHIHDRINKFNQRIEWPGIRQGALESQVKTVI